MRPLVPVLIFIITALLSGCSSNNIMVNATSEDRTVFDPSAESEKGATMPSTSVETSPGRSPFINLSTYDWDYSQWLEAFSERVADLRLPASVDTYVEITFYPAGKTSAPKIKVDCTAAPQDCSWLEAQIEALPTLPQLPAHFPGPQLAVKLSRVP